MTRAVLQQAHTYTLKPRPTPTPLSFLFLLCNCQSKLMQLTWPWAESEGFWVCHTAILLSRDEKRKKKESTHTHTHTHTHTQSCFFSLDYFFPVFQRSYPSLVCVRAVIASLLIWDETETLASAPMKSLLMCPNESGTLTHMLATWIHV